MHRMHEQVASGSCATDWVFKLRSPLGAPAEISPTAAQPEHLRAETGVDPRPQLENCPRSSHPRFWTPGSRTRKRAGRGRACARNDGRCPGGRPRRNRASSLGWRNKSREGIDRPRLKQRKHEERAGDCAGLRGRWHFWSQGSQRPAGVRRATSRKVSPTTPTAGGRGSILRGRHSTAHQFPKSLKFAARGSSSMRFD
jgi:hypothetical protein